MAQTLTQDDLDAIVAAIAAGKPFVTLADDVAHGGPPGSSTATLAFSRIAGVSQAADAPALKLVGNGGGSGAEIRGGAEYGTGVLMAGGAGGMGLQVQPGGVHDGDDATSPAVSFEGGVGAATLRVVAAFGSPGTGPVPLVVLDASNNDVGGDVVRLLTIAGHGISIAAAGSGKHDINLAGSGDILGGFTADPEANRGATAGDLTTTLMIERIYRRMFRDAGRTPTTVALLANDGTTPIATQPVTDDGAGTETQGPMS